MKQMLKLYVFCLSQLQFEDIAPLKKLRIGHDGKGDRKDWYLEKVREIYISQFDSDLRVNFSTPTSCPSATFVQPLFAFVLCFLRHKIMKKTQMR